MLLQACIPSPWTVRRLLLTILMCLPSLNTAVAGPPVLEAKHGLRLDGAPDTLLHLAFLIRNDSSETARFKEQLQLPKGWHPVLPLSEFEVPAGSHQLRLVSLQISASTPAGIAHIDYHLTELVANQHHSLTTEVNVAAKPGLLMTWQVPPSKWLFQNHPETLQALILNTGNTMQQLSVSLDKPGGLDGALSDRLLSLAPGEQAVLSVQIMAPTAVRGRPGVTLVLESDRATYRLNHRFEALITQAELDRHLRLPVQLQTAMTRSNGHLVWERALSGSGYLDEAQRHHLAFLVRRDQVALFADQDAVRQVLRYQSLVAEAIVGDFILSRSALTDTGRFGRGVALRSGTSEHPVRIGLHRLQTQRYLERTVDVQTTLGSAMTHQLIASEAKPMPRDESSADDSHQHWVSSVLHSPAERHHQWQFEWATSRVHGGPDGARYGQAWHLQSHGTLTGLAGVDYRVGGWHIDRNYAHPLRGTSVRHVDLSGPVGERARLRLHGHQRQAQRAALLTTRSQRLGMLLSYRLPANWRTEFGYQWQNITPAQRARPITQQYHIGLRRDWLKGSLNWQLAWRDGHVSGGSLSARYRPNRNLSLTMQQRRSSEVLEDMSWSSRRLSGRWGALIWRPSESWALHLSYAERVRQSDPLSPLITEPLRQQSHGFRARLDHTLSRHQRWWLETQRHQDALGDWDHIIRAGWAMTWQAPIRRRRDVGSLLGKIDPIPSQAVRIDVGGHSTLSDPTGQFTIPALPSGAHRVHIDQASLPPGTIVAEPTNLIAVIDGGSASHMTVQLMPAASIQGQIAIAESSWQGLNHIPPMLITLSTAGHSHHTVSDESGRFVFDLLKPGTWTLEVNATQWPAGYHMDSAAQILILDQGERRQLSLALIPNHRAIEFIDEGHLNE